MLGGWGDEVRRGEAEGNGVGMRREMPLEEGEFPWALHTD